MEEKYIATLDIGTTTIRSHIYNSKAVIVGQAYDLVSLHYPEPGYVEIKPDELWKSVVYVVSQALKDANLSASQVKALGISTQRGTFITWSRSTGKPFHNFITWKDLRAHKLVDDWNNSYLWKFIKIGASALYFLSRSKKFKVASVFKFMNTQTTLRFYWALQNVAALKSAVKSGDAMFGTVDTWLLYKLTDSKIHLTDVSSASATGFFDPFTMSWASFAFHLISLPSYTLPKVVDSVGDHFTSTDPTIWGHAIPIRSSMADQTASMWGSCCFEPGDVKLTMGTGTFLNIHTGVEPHASISGLYPVVGWRMGDELVYVAEGANNDTGSIITWAQSIGLFENPKDTADIAKSVPDSDGVYFIPAFSGLGPPHNDPSCASGFVGVKASTSRAHLVRAVLESLAYRTALLHRIVKAETTYHLRCIRVDGGVSANDFVTQLVADLTGLSVECSSHIEMSSRGVALLTGLHHTTGFWKSKDELKAMHCVSRVYRPRESEREKYEPLFERWEDALQRLSGWYAGSVPDNSSKEPRQSKKTK